MRSGLVWNLIGFFPQHIHPLSSPPLSQRHAKVFYAHGCSPVVDVVNSVSTSLRRLLAKIVRGHCSSVAKGLKTSIHFITLTEENSTKKRSRIQRRRELRGWPSAA